VNSQIKKLLEVSAKYVGVKESPRNSNNVVFNTHFYGRAVSGEDYPWCMVFVWDCFREAGLSSLFYGGKKTASCAELLDYAKSHKQFVEKDKLLAGDVVLFKFPTNKRPANHTGIALSDANSGGIKVREGNTAVGNDSNGGEVMDRARTLADVVGGYRPDYKEDEIVSDIEFEKMMDIWLAKRGRLPAADNLAPADFEAAIAAGLTDGTRPQAPASRQEVAVMAYRAMRKARE
jgi:hypothetical protein